METPTLFIIIKLEKVTLTTLIKSYNSKMLNDQL